MSMLWSKDHKDKVYNYVSFNRERKDGPRECAEQYQQALSLNVVFVRET